MLSFSTGPETPFPHQHLGAGREDLQEGCIHNNRPGPKNNFYLEGPKDLRFLSPRGDMRLVGKTGRKDPTRKPALENLPLLKGTGAGWQNQPEEPIHNKHPGPCRSKIPLPFTETPGKPENTGQGSPSHPSTTKKQQRPAL